MSRLFLKLILLLTPIVAATVITNVLVDSGDILGGMHRSVARILVSGKNAGLSNIPSGWGTLQEAVVAERARRKQTGPLDILVFGTSRSSEITGDLFSASTFFNCAVPGGSVLDSVALYGLYNKGGMLPKYVIISIDPWSFTGRKKAVVSGKEYLVADAGATLAVSKGLEACYQRGSEDLGITLPEAYRPRKVTDWSRLRDYLEMFSPAYFKASLGALASSSPITVFETDKKVGSSFFVIRKDGSYSLIEESAVDAKRVEATAQKYADAQQGRLFQYNPLYMNSLYALLDGLKKKGVVPVVYLSPLHPSCYDNVTRSGKNSLESDIKRYCSGHGVITVGSFNPHVYNAEGCSFIDEYHPVPSLVRAIFEAHRRDLERIGLHLAGAAARAE